VLEVLYHHAKFGEAQISPAAGSAKMLSFLSACFSVRHAYLNAVGVRQVAPIVLREFYYLLVHGQVTIIFVVSVGLSVCLSVCLFACLFAQSFSQPSLIRFRSN